MLLVLHGQELTYFLTENPPAGFPSGLWIPVAEHNVNVSFPSCTEGGCSTVWWQ